MTTITKTKCACANCICNVDLDKAIIAEGKPYCSKACAEGHPDGTHGCGCDSGCNC